MTRISRRDFLKLTRDGFLYLSGFLSLAGLLRFLSYESNPAPQTEFEVGAADDFPPGSQTLLPKIPALLIRSAQGFAALSLTCTHLGCALESSAEGFACPCHNSSFDADGKVTHGPASLPLKKLRVEVVENSVWVFVD
jgi:Rieske Fe-S protein